MNTKSIVKWCDQLIVIGIFIMVFAVPLFFDIHLYSTFDLSKVGMMFFITLFLLALWLVKMVSLKDFRSIRTPFDFVVFAFLLSNIASTIFSLNPVMSLFGCYKRYEGLLAITCYIVIYYLTVNFIKTKRQVLGILTSILIVGTISGGYALVQHFGMDPLSWESFNPWRIISFFGNPVFYTVYALMSLLIGFGLYLYIGREKDEVKRYTSKPVIPQKTKKKKKIEVFAAAQPAVSPLLGNTVLTVIACIAILITYWGFALGNTRGCYLGLFGGSFAFFCLIGKKIFIMDKKKLLALGLGLFVLFFYYNIMVKESSVIGRFSGLFVKADVSNLSSVEKATHAQTPIKGVAIAMPWRIFIWRSAIETIKDYPIFGTGPDTMGLVFPKYLQKIFPKDGKGPIEFEDRTHQDFLDHAVARGAIGAFIYIWGIACFLLLVWKFYRHSTLAGRPIVLCLGASVIGYIIQNQVSFSVTPVSCTLAIIAGIIVRSGWIFQQPSTTTPCLSNNSILDKTLNIAFFSGCSFIPQQLSERKGKPKNENVLYVGYILILCGFICVTHLTWRMYVADGYYKMGTVYLGRDNKRAVEEYQKAIDSFPYEVRYRDEINRAYIEQARNAATDEERILWAKKADAGANEILRRTPGYANGYFTLGIANYLLSKTENDGFTQKAINYYKKASEINPFSSDTYNNLGVIYTKQNNLDAALAVFKEAYRMNPAHVASMDNVARIYITKNEPEKALDVLNELQKINPNYQAARIQNMIGYLCWQLGRFDEVVQRCKNALEADPKDISALENLGTVYMKKGMYKEAAMQFQRVLEVEPGNPKAMKMLQAITARR
ncbi:tetratricopeptide repeat protein [bacterium]|nr:tetratricopeptide repeat protein [bacterium]MBU1754322.1 tetratricopeptide repeat protein [bacterium]